MKGYLFSAIVAGLFGVLLTHSAITVMTFALAPAQVASPILADPPVTKSSVVTLNFVGDIMLDRGVYLSVEKNGGGDFHWLFDHVGDLANSDILFGNLEGPLSDRGRELDGVYSFRMKPEAAAALSSAGFDILSSANNHIGDWGYEAATDTVRRLAEVGITAVGVGANQDIATPKIVERNGLKVGFLAFSDVGPSWLTVGDQQLPEIIKQAASQVDQLVVSFHFGEEYREQATERQKYLAHLAIDNGARIVVGTHPHVVEEVERYNDGLIAYSLGNFIFDQAFSEDTMRGLVLEIELDKNSIVRAQTRESWQDSSFRPHLSLESTDV